MTAAIARGRGHERPWADTPHAEQTRALLAAMRVAGEAAERVEWLASELYRVGYVLPAEQAVVIAGAVFTRRVLMLRGTPGCGKTYLAECLSRVFNPGLPLLRIEGHEEVSVESLLYAQDTVGLELFLRTAPASIGEAGWLRVCEEARSRFVHFGPVIQSIVYGAEQRRRRVLLVDEFDKFRGESEALLLSFLNDYSVSASHVNLFVAPEPGLEPIVVVTANESREIQQPTQRRCVVVPVTTPTVLEEAEILGLAVEGLRPFDRCLILLLAFRIRSESLGLTKPLSISEVIDFATAIAYFAPERLTAEFVEAHTPYLAKNRTDQYLLRLKVRQCLEWAESQMRECGGSTESARALLADLDRKQREARRRRDDDLRL